LLLAARIAEIPQYRNTAIPYHKLLSAGVGYYFKALNSISSAAQDLSHVMMGDITWGQFFNMRLLDVAGYTLKVGWIIDILDIAYRLSS
jgi:hypothetical protein